MGYEMAEGAVWFLYAAGVLFCLSALLFVVDWHRRQAEKVALSAGVHAAEIAETERLAGLAETIEVAEWQLGMVMARLRAHAGNAYTVQGYRIRTEADFERSLDIAAALSVRIGDLAGAASPDGPEAELKRVREQIRRSVAVLNPRPNRKLSGNVCQLWAMSRNRGWNRRRAGRGC